MGISLEFVLLRRTKRPKRSLTNPFKEIQMYVTPEQIQATTKANMDAILSLATNQFAAFE